MPSLAVAALLKENPRGVSYVVAVALVEAILAGFYGITLWQIGAGWAAELSRRVTHSQL